MNDRKLKLNLQNFIYSLVLILNIFLFNCNSLPQKPDTIPKNDYSYLNEYLNNYIPTKMDEASVVGLAVSVVTDKEIFYAMQIKEMEEKSIQIPSLEPHPCLRLLI